MLYIIIIIFILVFLIRFRHTKIKWNTFLKKGFAPKRGKFGVIGALIPVGIIYVLYNKVIEYIVAKFATLSQLLSFLSVETIFSSLLPISIAMGVGIGFLGSITTVRKHLRV